MALSTVNIVASSAPLLSGALNECVNSEDETCQGGGAAALAFLRSFSENPTLVLPQLDKTSPFVFMHSLKWAVNLLILQTLFQWSVFVSSPSMLLAGNKDLIKSTTKRAFASPNNKRHCSSEPPSSSWSAYHEIIQFDSLFLHLGVSTTKGPRRSNVAAIVSVSHLSWCVLSLE